MIIKKVKNPKRTAFTHEMIIRDINLSFILEKTQITITKP